MAHGALQSLAWDLDARILRIKARPQHWELCSLLSAIFV